MSEPSLAAQSESRKPLQINHGSFILLVLLVVGGAILRSAIATRLDDFTFDEAYHIAAGASYVQRGDFRINPEHPPFVKLWVGSLMSATGFHLSPFREFHDKFDERTFAEEDVFFHNNPDSVQRRSRIAMWTLNGLLLIALALALRRSFGPIVALGTALFLAIDPTVAAHLPVVMTDLPVALLSGIAVALATRAFRFWAGSDLALCSVALGFALGAKHSGPVFYIFLGITGFISALFVRTSESARSRAFRLTKVFGVLLGALVILWGLYFFRFSESRSEREVFNRPLADKISDVNSPVYRFALRQMSRTHVTPRAYIWGFADTIRAGLEGRAESQLAFGRLYYKKAPWYFFPGVIAVKLPIGLTILALFGVYLLGVRRLPAEWNTPATIVLAASLCFLLVLRSGSTYAGIRHALPVVPLLAMLGGMASHVALTSKVTTLKVVVALSFLGAGASALPVLRPWEYFNEIVGGAKIGYVYFDDEGVDLSQRTKEMARYYREVLQPAGEVPYIDYEVMVTTEKARGLDWVGRDPKRDEARLTSPVWSGTIFEESKLMSRRLWWDAAALRAATPIARFGNLLVFRGTFALPGKQATTLFFAAVRRIYISDKPDLDQGERLLRQSAEMDPSAFFVNIELGNVCLRRGSREDALRAYTAALEHTPDDHDLRQSIQEQLQRVARESLDKVPPLRNPNVE
jgi:Dolichyl-phosphate-mannose-protein mannosyltransferase